MAIYEGSDTYEEFSGKASIVNEQLQHLRSTPLRVRGRKYKMELGLFGDMAFLNEVQGGSGCNCREPCIECDVQNCYLHYSPDMFRKAGLDIPKAMDYARRCRLAHAYGEEYGITQPYVCEGCQKIISEHRQYAPQTSAQDEAHRHTGILTSLNVTASLRPSGLTSQTYVPAACMGSLTYWLKRGMQQSHRTSRTRQPWRESTQWCAMNGR